MKKFVLVLPLVLIFCFTSLTEATLFDRGGGLIYCDTLNITWLQDASHAKTSAYDADGLMNWSTAVKWAKNLEYNDSVRSVIWDDWRLPNTLPVNGVSYDYDVKYDGSTDVGYNITSPNSEMAYLYYEVLDNLGYFDINGQVQANSGLINEFPFDFDNLYSPQRYWSGTGHENDINFAWYFDFTYGRQQSKEAKYLEHYAWAVRSGDVVPEPGTIVLLLFGMVGIIGIKGFLRLLHNK